MSETPNGLALLRQPFPPHHISKLPKPTAKRDEMDRLPKATCNICGGWHATSKVIHLDYVGHAALTDRLLDADPMWTWEPLAINKESGLPVIDEMGGLWIRLTVCGVTRLGYGDAGEKSGPNAIKEAIGDALRNAAMRFGAALDLWHKGDLHADERRHMPESELLDWKASIDGASNVGEFKRITAEAEAACNGYGDRDALAAVQACAAAKAAKAKKSAVPA